MEEPKKMTRQELVVWLREKSNHWIEEFNKVDVGDGDLLVDALEIVNKIKKELK